MIRKAAVIGFQTGSKAQKRTGKLFLFAKQTVICYTKLLDIIYEESLTSRWVVCDK